MKKIIYTLLGMLLINVTFSHEVDASDTQVDQLEMFTTAFFQEKIDEGQFPGAVISVVLDGNIILLKGIGYQDLEKTNRIDPTQTLFRVGSVGKTFTATAAMQLVDEHHWHAKDIQVWDDINIVPDSGTPLTSITLHHLLTHTSGYDETLISFYADHKDEVSNADYIKKYHPPQKRSPGTEIEYSNFGMALVGQWVEDVSGQPFPKYIEKNIFKPLGMTESSFIQDDRLPHLSSSYYSGQVYPYHYLHMVPAGTLTSTAENMARFMNAHLEKSDLLGSESMFNEMHKTQHRMHEHMPGMAYGFYEGIINGRKILRHEGSVDTFVSEMVLIPEEKLGIFVSLNGVTGNETASIPGEYIRELSGMLFPETTANNQKSSSLSSTSIDVLKELEGSYMFNRRVAHGPLRVLSFFQLPTTNVKVLSDGVIEISDIFNKENSQRFIETDMPFHFRSDSNEEVVMFLQDDQRTTFIHSQFPQVMFEPTGWSDGRWGLVFGTGVIVLVSLLVMIVFPIKGIYRWQRKLKDQYRHTRVLLFFQALSLLLSIGSVLLALNSLVYGVSTLSYILLSTPMIPLILSFVIGLIVFKKASPRHLRNWYVAISGCVILLLGLWIWWDLTPFHLY